MPSKAGTKKRGRGSSPGSQNNNGRKKRGLNIPSGSNVNALDQLVVPAPNVRSRDSSMASSTMASSKYIKNNEQRIRLNLAKPVFIEAGSQEIIAEVKKMGLSKDPYFKKTFDGKTQVLCQSPEDKKILIDSLKEHKKFEHFTFSEPKDKPSIYVLKGLDRFECHDVLQQLKDNDIPALKVTFLVDNINSSNKKKFFSPLYLVHFTKSQKIVEQQITLNLLQRNFRTINMLIVKWERFDRRRKRISQCHNCQRFGHSATNCGHKNRCVKCEQSHQPGQCSRQSRDDPGSPKCVNCTGEHPANSSSCQVYKSYAAKVNKIRTNRINIDNFNSSGRSPKTNLLQEHFPKLNQLQEVATSSSSSHIISGSSYANVMKQQKNVWFQNRRAKVRKREHTKKGPGRPAHNAHPQTCSGEPIPPEEIRAREKARRRKKIAKAIERQARKLRAKGITVDLEALKAEYISQHRGGQTLSNSSDSEENEEEDPIDVVGGADDSDDDTEDCSTHTRRDSTDHLINYSSSSEETPKHTIRSNPFSIESLLYRST